MSLTNKKTNLSKSVVMMTLLFFAIIGVIIFFIIIPSLDTIKSLRRDILLQKKDLEIKLVREKNMSELNGKLKTIEPKLKRLDNIFMNQSREAEFITIIEDIAIKNNIKETIVPSNAESKNEGDYRVVPISINATGDFKNLLSFLANLESLKQYFVIDNLQLDTLSAKSSPLTKLNDDNFSKSSTVQLKITAYTYWK
jgi:Tfp pilus assembly protein PilO